MKTEIICSDTSTKCKKCNNKSRWHILDYDNCNDSCCDGYSTASFYCNNTYYSICDKCYKEGE